MASIRCACRTVVESFVNGLARSDFPDFNDPNKLGEGQAMVERLSNLIGIFPQFRRLAIEIPFSPYYYLLGKES